MTEHVAGRWPALLPAGNADAAVAAARASQGAPIFEVVAACTACGVRQIFRGTAREIGDAAEMWQQGHSCAARLGESGSATLTNGGPVRLPGVG